MPSRNWTTLSLTAALTLTAFATAASAVQPQRWTHTSEADFAPGTVQDAVVTNLGDVKLATSSDLVGEMPEQASIIYDLQRIGDTLYVAAGPEAKLMRRDANGELVEVIALPNEQVFTLDQINGQLLVAISGSPSRLAVLEDDELVTLAELEDVRYIWDTVARGLEIYLATGTDGRVLKVARDPNGAVAEEATVLLETAQSNVLTLVMDRNGQLYAGTDTDGLIYRLTETGPDEWEPFVLYDAPEPEVAALLVLDDGTVYAGTADAEQARPGRLGEAVDDPAGRPDVPPTPEPDAPADEELPEPDDIPAVPPDADPIGDPDEDGDAPDQPKPDEANGDADDDIEDPVEDPAPDPMRTRINQWRHTHPLQNESDTEADAASAARPEPNESDDTESTPTDDQHDRLREQVRGRLMDARDSGTLQAGVRVTTQPARRAPNGNRARPVATSRPDQQGNAIYRIDPEGFVHEVFRESVMIFKIVQAGNRLLVATGNEGQVFSVNPRTEETTIIADLDPEQVTTMLLTDEGDLIMGTANAAQLVRLDDDIARRGTYTSPVMDAEQISLFGTLRLTAAIPDGASVLVETRSGNVGDPDQAPWSAWSDAQTFRHNPDASALQPREVTVTSPPARFLQYRLTLLGDGRQTPTVSEVDTAYVMPNLPPRVRSVRASYPEPARGRAGQSADDAPPTAMRVQWEASDPNEDAIVYKLEYQPAGSSRYILIAEDITETSYEWQTRRVPDGRYVLRVTASDRTDNPPDMARTTNRRSDAVLVDNTAPAFDELEVAADDGTVRVTGRATDAHSPVQSIAYAVDSTDDYTPVLPEDLIFDSTRERFNVTIPDLDPGHHVVTLRVRDARGNTRHQAVMVDVQ
ncbi:MAG: hypothetical protein WDZ31_11165 [Phycisphaeraceae bacterium]